MKVYKLKGSAKCVFCGEGADLYIDGLHVTVCRKCGVALYKNLGEHFVPKAVPNVVIRNEKQYKPLSTILIEDTAQNDTTEEGTQTIIFEEKDRKTKEVFQKLKRKLREFSMKFKVKGETNERDSK